MCPKFLLHQPMPQRRRGRPARTATALFAVLAAGLPAVARSSRVLSGANEGFEFESPPRTRFLGPASWTLNTSEAAPHGLVRHGGGLNDFCGDDDVRLDYRGRVVVLHWHGLVGDCAIEKAYLRLAATGAAAALIHHDVEQAPGIAYFWRGLRWEVAARRTFSSSLSRESPRRDIQHTHVPNTRDRRSPRARPNSGRGLICRHGVVSDVDTLPPSFSRARLSPLLRRRHPRHRALLRRARRARQPFLSAARSAMPAAHITAAAATRLLASPDGALLLEVGSRVIPPRQAIASSSLVHHSTSPCRTAARSIDRGGGSLARRRRVRSRFTSQR